MQLQKGRWAQCGCCCRSEDLLEVHHREGTHCNKARGNRALRPRHGHDEAQGPGGWVKHQALEAPEDPKGARPVLKPSIEG